MDSFLKSNFDLVVAFEDVWTTLRNDPSDQSESWKRCNYVDDVQKIVLILYLILLPLRPTN